MNGSKWSRPSGLARWGWLFTALQVVIVLVNLSTIVFADGGVWNWLAAAFAAGCGVYCFNLWRRAIEDDRKHRAFMAELDRKWAQP